MFKVIEKKENCVEIMAKTKSDAIAFVKAFEANDVRRGCFVKNSYKIKNLDSIGEKISRFVKNLFVKKHIYTIDDFDC